MWAGQLWQAGWVRLSLGVRGAGIGAGIGQGAGGVSGQGVLWPPWQDGWSNMSQSGLGYIPHQSHPSSMAVASAGLGMLRWPWQAGYSVWTVFPSMHSTSNPGESSSGSPCVWQML